ncbi:AbfB domain-containing protein [Oerskovia flava]|uniref:AbfB domain-containing protein n=1 Tax=Oerskovia flava TaxID=2986422 RepID=UPI002240CD18|nr:AbfB domain-containing protein [Oerskovia sp. JB1-3-2]
MSSRTSHPRHLTRRSFLTVAAAGTLAAAFPLTPASAVGRTLRHGPLVAATTPASSLGAHPGLLHTTGDLSYLRPRVAAGLAPWSDGWARLTQNGRSSSGWQPRPLTTVVRGGTGQNYAQMYPDIHAAYQNAVRWRLGGGDAHGDAAVRILNAWSSTQTGLAGNADRFLASGIYGYQWANAAELVRDHPDFDVEAFRTLLLDVYHPMAEHFLTHHNGAVITNYWANWDLANMCAVLAIGAFADRPDLVDRALEYFETGAGNGSILHAVPHLHDDGLGQWQESGRDQGHSVMGIGLMGAFCEMAWNLGVDCYGYDDNRFLKGAEYVAKYNLGHDVPFTPYTWQSGPATTAPHVGWNTQTAVSDIARGHVRPVWELVLGHYAGRRGLHAPWVEQMAATVRAEGGGGDYGSTSGGYDQLGFGTLLQSARTSPSRFEALGRPGAFLRHRGYVGRVEASVSPADDARFRMVPGLASSAGGRVSFESVNFPGHYLRHDAYALRLVADDGTAQLAADATFEPVAGLADPSLVSFRSHNIPDRYLRDLSGTARIDVVTSAAERASATFRESL